MTLAKAHEQGYFDVPRTGSTEDLAKTSGISISAVSKPLSQAIVRVIETHLLYIENCPCLRSQAEELASEDPISACFPLRYHLYTD